MSPYFEILLQYTCTPFSLKVLIVDKKKSEKTYIVIFNKVTED